MIQKSLTVHSKTRQNQKVLYTLVMSFCRQNFKCLLFVQFALNRSWFRLCISVITLLDMCAKIVEMYFNF